MSISKEALDAPSRFASQAFGLNFAAVAPLEEA